jgi:hypothetical protein
METSAGEKVRAPPGATSTMKVVAPAVCALAKVKIAAPITPSKNSRKVRGSEMNFPDFSIEKFMR